MVLTRLFSLTTSVYVGTHMPQCALRGQRTTSRNRSSPSTTWATGIKSDHPTWRQICGLTEPSPLLPREIFISISILPYPRVTHHSLLISRFRG